MKIPYNDLLALHEPIMPELRQAIEDVLSSCQFVGNSRNSFVQRFEDEFAAFSGVSHSIGCSNGTEAVSHVGARPVFADIQPRQFTLDPLELAKRTNERTKAIIPVHLYGQPADMDPILEFANSRSLHVIEDCAQAHGARYKDRPVGAMGIAGTFSFYPGKNLGAIGEAGGIVTESSDIRDTVRSLRDHGLAANGGHDREGRNARLDGIQAAVLSVKLTRLEAWTRQRQSLGAYYRERLKEIGVGFQEVLDDRSHVYHVFCAQVENRDAVREGLDQAGVQTGIHYPTPLPFLDAYSEIGYANTDFPNARRQSCKALSLPLHPGMTPQNVDYVIAQLDHFLS